MCDLSKRKSPGYCRSRNRRLTVPRTRWELPIPSSKPYWDQVCQQIEKSMQHVRDPFPHFPSKYPDSDADDHKIFENSNSIASNPIDSLTEPIVKISPPTPSRKEPRNIKEIDLDALIKNEDLTIVYHEEDHPKNLDLENKAESNPDESKLTEVSKLMTEFLTKREVKTREKCVFHRNMQPVQIFDDNLKDFLPKKKQKLKDDDKTRIVQEDPSDFSKFHSKHNCPLLFRPETNSNGSKPHEPDGPAKSNRERPKTAGFHESRPTQNYEFPQELLKTVKCTPATSRNRKLNERSRSETFETNLKAMLEIPKLREIGRSESLFAIHGNIANKKVTFSDEADAKNESIKHLFSLKTKSKSTSSDSEQRTCTSRNFKVPKLGTVSLHPSFNRAVSTESLDELYKSLDGNNPSESVKNAISIPSGVQSLPEIPEKLSSRAKSAGKRNTRNEPERIDSEKSEERPAKDFLKVPKLGTISSYPCFNKLVSADSLDRDFVDPSSRSALLLKHQDDLGQSTDLLKVPKLNAISSYPSFNSLHFDSSKGKVQQSISSSEETEGHPNIFDHKWNETKFMKNKCEIADESSKRSWKFRARTDAKSASVVQKLKMTKSEKKAPSRSFMKDEQSRQSQSMKYSMKYAYRALKFLTPNKSLVFDPQSYDHSQKSRSQSGSSVSSCTSDPSKVEPTYKMLVNKDIISNRSADSTSLSSYETITTKLRKQAAKYLGQDYIFPSPKLMSKTSSRTIPSTTRTTSGPSSKFVAPNVEEPSIAILRNIPDMSIFPRKNHDRCFACLHKPFEKKVTEKRELPLTILNEFAKEAIPIISDCDSSSVSLPDFQNLADAVSELGDSPQAAKSQKNLEKEPMGASIEQVSSKNSIRSNTEIKASEEILPEATNQSLSPKNSLITNGNSLTLSVSSDHSKHSSPSGHSSESEDNQNPVEQSAPTAKYFVPCHAPINLRPSLEPLKALRSRKPISMHSRSASAVNKSVDESDSEGSSENDLTIAKKGSVKETVYAQNKSKTRQDSSDEGSSTKSKLKIGEKLDASSFDQRSMQKQSTIEANTGEQCTNDRKKVQDSKEANITMKVEPKISRTFSVKSLVPGDDKLGELPRLKSVSEKIALLRVEDSPINSQALKEHSMTEDPSRPITDDLENQNFTKNLLKSTDEQSSTKPLTSKPSFKLMAELSVKSDECGISRKSPESSKEEESREDESIDQSIIISEEELADILRLGNEENLTPLEMLKTLSNKFSQLDRDGTVSPRIARSMAVAKKLVKLLVESKEYLIPEKLSSNRTFSSKQPPLCNSRQLRRILPLKSYNLVAPILGMPKWYITKSYGETKLDVHKSRSSKLGHSNDGRKFSTETVGMMVHPPTHRGPSSSQKMEGFEYPQKNPYALFIDKPRRKAVTWRPLTDLDLRGYDPEATLNMRATRVTDKICEDFCHWLRGLGGSDEGIDEEVLKDMFQIDFTADACRTMQVLINEMPMVPFAVAQTRKTPGAGELALTRQHLIRDAKAERRPKRTQGFGSNLPREMRFIPPKNQVQKEWLQCENVPDDLETMDAVWKGITHLDTVKGFIAWLREHPHVKPPKALEEVLANKKRITRQSLEDDGLAHLELELDQIRSLKVGDNDPDMDN